MDMTWKASDLEAFDVNASQYGDGTIKLRLAGARKRQQIPEDMVTVSLTVEQAAKIIENLAYWRHQEAEGTT
jgi:hypothetical protein